ncbi:hypothetical protein C8A06_0125 [Microbacteriaceae bacterium MWH-Ta3]|nr:hypothetical protein C8A06_0125 [Microbacteriaceae bacterium MWH-Ta3]
MNSFTKGLAIASVISLGSWGFATSAQAATTEQVQSYLVDAVAAQLGLTDTTLVSDLITEALANNLIAPELTGAVSDVVDGVSTVTPEELAVLLNANLISQLDALQAQVDALQPGTTDPGTTDPGTSDPGTTDPGTTDPGTTDPGTVTVDDDDDVLDGEHHGRHTGDDDDDNADDDSDDSDDDSEGDHHGDDGEAGHHGDDDSDDDED